MMLARILRLLFIVPVWLFLAAFVAVAAINGCVYNIKQVFEVETAE